MSCTNPNPWNAFLEAPSRCSNLASRLFKIERSGPRVQLYNGWRRASPIEAGRFAGRMLAIKDKRVARPAVGRSADTRREDDSDAAARFACEYPRTAGARIAAVHCIRAGARDCPMQGRHRRLVPGVERPSR